MAAASARVMVSPGRKRPESSPASGGVRPSWTRGLSGFSFAYTYETDSGGKVNGRYSCMETTIFFASSHPWSSGILSRKLPLPDVVTLPGALAVREKDKRLPGSATRFRIPGKAVSGGSCHHGGQRIRSLFRRGLHPRRQPLVQ